MGLTDHLGGRENRSLGDWLLGDGGLFKSDAPHGQPFLRTKSGKTKVGPATSMGGLRGLSGSRPWGGRIEKNGGEKPKKENKAKSTKEIT